MTKIKRRLQAAVSAVALAGLAWVTAAQAASLAELPLKVSALAKPNVIFGMDDSGSMDTEVMMYANDGAFWWNFTDANGWGIDAAHPNPSLRTLTTPRFNAVGDATATWRKIVYLFPNGSGTGNRGMLDAANDHFAPMPTTQFASLRWSGVWRDAGGVYRSPSTTPADSPLHNPIYYNPLVTYKPWAPAQLAGGAVSPAQAASAAAKSHPIYGTSTLNLTANVAANTNDNFVFTALPGMRIPAGAQTRVCNNANGGCAAWGTALAADANAAANAVTRVAMAYYPATYWVREACTVPGTASVGTDSCTYLPGSTTVTLKRYEIKSGNTFPSGRSYSAEMENFANWFQYYRKRKMMLAGAMGETMENLTGMRLGVVAFNSHATPRMFDADSTDPTANRLRLAGIFYETDRSGGTPTRETLNYIGTQFGGNDSTGAAIVQYACQRNNAFIVTDGFANVANVTMPAYQTGKSAATWGAGAPYETVHAGSLADLALRLYTNNPRTALATGRLPATPADANNDLHINTYGLTMGARGTLFFDESSPVPTTTGAWPAPDQNRNPSAVDDLWHATINGRGKMYLASTPEETALRIRAGLDDILSQLGAQSAIGVSSVNLGRGDDYAYLGRYNSRGWAGDLTRHAVNNATGAVSTTSAWSAASLLAARDWTTRVIFTNNASAGIDFSVANVGATVNPDTVAYTNTQVVQWMRGSRTGEGDTVRLRTSLLGAVINAEPVVSRADGVVYLASGEGMLHAFDTATGAELWAYHPSETLASAGASVARNWTFKTQLDATPTFAQLSSTLKMLVGGLGAAGRSYYALDVSSPRPANVTAAAAQFKWTFPASTDTANKAQMGYTVGKPVLTKTAADGNVVLVTSGYDNGTSIGDGKGRLWMLNATTGAVIKTFRTTEGVAGTGEAGLAHVSAMKEADGTTRYAYGGDLLGNIWKFDLARAGSSLDAELVATLYDGSGNRQPVTAAPELLATGGKRVILVGTGRVLDIGDFGSARTQSFYAIADGATLSNARNGLTARSYSRANDNGTVGSTPLTGSAFNWTTGRGWYFDLPAGEQANTLPVITYGSVAFVSNVNGSSDCSQSSYLYLVDVATGLKVANSTFVSSLISSAATASRVVTLRAVDGKIFGTSHRSDGTIYQRQLPVGATIPPSKNSWRELRR